MTLDLFLVRGFHWVRNSRALAARRDWLLDFWCWRVIGRLSSSSNWVLGVEGVGGGNSSGRAAGGQMRTRGEDKAARARDQARELQPSEEEGGL